MRKFYLVALLSVLLYFLVVNHLKINLLIVF